MGLRKLEVAGFRNLENGGFEPGANINIISGDNAAGKTSLLEAIHVLARARSFRAPRLEQVICHGEPLLRVTGDVDVGTVRHRLGLERSRQQIRVRIDSQDVRNLSQLASYLPVQVINSESQRLLQDGPRVRRSFLNWSVFHVEQPYHGHWRRFDRALRQRNAGIRSGDARMSRAWEPELVNAGLELDAARRRLVDALTDALQPLLSQWLPDVEVGLSYRSGWAKDQSFEQALAGARDRERELGHTLVGPHRGDLVIRANGVDAQHWLSRGQQKGLVIAILLAQTAHLAGKGSVIPILLIDDLAAELDASRREAVMQAVRAIEAQVFVTVIDPDSAPVEPAQATRFHVEHGKVRKMV
ncbi:MAG: DNA replication/repair protein RecF [Aquisalimonadaceae bacterium]